MPGSFLPTLAEDVQPGVVSTITTATNVAGPTGVRPVVPLRGFGRFEDFFERLF